MKRKKADSACKLCQGHGFRAVDEGDYVHEFDCDCTYVEEVHSEKV